MIEISKRDLIEWLDEAYECWKRETIHVNERIEGDKIKEYICILIENEMLK